MDRVFAIRAAGLYLPIAVAFLLVLLRQRPPRLFGAGLVGILWTLPSLLAVQLLNLRFEWWSFHASGGFFRGIPVDLYLGWAVLWGLLPVLAFRRLKSCWVMAIFLGIDLALMPACRPVVELGRGWILGEAVAICLVLVPAQLLARWTLEDRRLEARATLQVLMSAGVFLFWLPEIAFVLRMGRAWEALLIEGSWTTGIELQCVFLLGVLGISAAQEFAQRGGGTPIPYDPPKKLVASGVYRYVANPMQMSCSAVMVAWGVVMDIPLYWLAAVISILYGLGVANWDEGEDLKTRFGEAWRRYRRHVRAWRIRFRPWHDPELPPALLYVAETCGPCSEVRRWFEAHRASGLAIVAAEDHPTRDLRRVTYDPQDGSETEEGVRAIARGLEHIHFGWAFAGACLRLPVVADFVQLLLDASGLGPRRISRRTCGQQGARSWVEGTDA
ncbi:MAG: methyltransferase family protein [Candidatus Acidiferrales bacterium]